MVIDWQHHYCPPELLRLRGRKPLPAGTPIRNAQGQVLSHSIPELFDIEAHLAFMDSAGIDKAVLSMAGSITHEETRVINDAFAALVAKRPDRFTALASCVPCKGDASVR
jgi:predicted TIM-barrel fold metal-dependent hydrolase